VRIVDASSEKWYEQAAARLRLIINHVSRLYPHAQYVDSSFYDQSPVLFSEEAVMAKFGLWKRNPIIPELLKAAFMKYIQTFCCMTVLYA
jgi:hypothetical protein